MDNIHNKSQDENFPLILNKDYYLFKESKPKHPILQFFELYPNKNAGTNYCLHRFHQKLSSNKEKEISRNLYCKRRSLTLNSSIEFLKDNLKSTDNKVKTEDTLYKKEIKKENKKDNNKESNNENKKVSKKENSEIKIENESKDKIKNKGGGEGEKGGGGGEKKSKKKGKSEGKGKYKDNNKIKKKFPMISKKSKQIELDLSISSNNKIINEKDDDNDKSEDSEDIGQINPSFYGKKRNFTKRNSKLNKLLSSKRESKKIKTFLGRKSINWGRNNIKNNKMLFRMTCESHQFIGNEILDNNFFFISKPQNKSQKKISIKMNIQKQFNVPQKGINFSILKGNLLFSNYCSLSRKMDDNDKSYLYNEREVKNNRKCLNKDTNSKMLSLFSPAENYRSKLKTLSFEENENCLGEAISICTNNPYNFSLGNMINNKRNTRNIVKNGNTGDNGNNGSTEDNNINMSNVNNNNDIQSQYKPKVIKKIINPNFGYKNTTLNTYSNYIINTTNNIINNNSGNSGIEHNQANNNKKNTFRNNVKKRTQSANLSRNDLLPPRSPNTIINGIQKCTFINNNQNSNNENILSKINDTNTNTIIINNNNTVNQDEVASKDSNMDKIYVNDITSNNMNSNCNIFDFEKDNCSSYLDNTNCHKSSNKYCSRKNVIKNSISVDVHKFSTKSQIKLIKRCNSINSYPLKSSPLNCKYREKFYLAKKYDKLSKAFLALEPIKEEGKIFTQEKAVNFFNDLAFKNIPKSFINKKISGNESADITEIDKSISSENNLLEKNKLENFKIKIKDNTQRHLAKKRFIKVSYNPNISFKYVNDKYFNLLPEILSRVEDDWEERDGKNEFFNIIKMTFDENKLTLNNIDEKNNVILFEKNKINKRLITETLMLIRSSKQVVSYKKKWKCPGRRTSEVQTIANKYLEICQDYDNNFHRVSSLKQKDNESSPSNRIFRMNNSKMSKVVWNYYRSLKKKENDFSNDNTYHLGRKNTIRKVKKDDEDYLKRDSNNIPLDLMARSAGKTKIHSSGVEGTIKNPKKAPIKSLKSKRTMINPVKKNMDLVIMDEKKNEFDSICSKLDNFNILSNKHIFAQENKMFCADSFQKQFAKLLRANKNKLILNKKLKNDKMIIKCAGYDMLTKEASLIKTQEIEMDLPAVKKFEKLVHAIEKRKIKLFDRLIEEVSGEVINRQDGSTGNTLLIYATQNNIKNIVEKLLIRGCNPNIQNKFGNTALHISYKGNYSFITNLLLQYYANEKIKNNDGLYPWQMYEL